MTRSLFSFLANLFLVTLGPFLPVLALGLAFEAF
jgi:hypothetical protein